MQLSCFNGCVIIAIVSLIIRVPARRIRDVSMLNVYSSSKIFVLLDALQLGSNANAAI
jgi:hypothetical protein